ncbi:PQQ-dependent sugar dehydrogenase [Pantoea ananatis]|uniref:PQQ-dependent sugar dehydrogenase n=1 Tax=Pantoea ananas TaxID=553 RepID=UPI0021E724AF|nr:PQQ-dependent sugar dehydrogenase [Pantoea ananatis]MCW0305760.1 Aldose sugar dehydrogenase YliI [Pantoea ananatis]MCW0337465.1 Aldose sugar dehydrogenase YliI [Pantoea ananatis]MCW0356740.1 Aldose sugar dehydrogenase YliI [Pantoea ananatis]MCW0361363.1 Aldose sugar dehydrogenase YliI [Pantoea ananatis]MCW1773804.1 PQQ-dependent sugar dehydrogenase [Pantoea ananatis]
MVRIPTPLLLSGALLFSSPLWASDLKVEVLQDKLDHPWSVAFLPDNQTLLITERSGQLRSWRPDSGLSEPIQGVPKVWAQRQSGLLDVVLTPDFAQSRRVWLSYTEADSNGKAGAVVGYGKLSPDNRQLTDFHEVIQQTPRLSSGNNIGTRLAFDRQGFLWIAFGDNFVSSAAQDLDKLQGKLLRLNADGSVPNDNPFVNKPGARPEIWAYGLRNPQGLALNPWTQMMWESEHGPRGGDEVNIIQKGKNYGWPLATYGIDYNGSKVPESKGTHVTGTEQPAFYWKVSPAISGMAFYNSARFPQWKNSLFIGALKEKNLIRLHINGEKVVEEQRLLDGRNERIRDVRQGPDGYLYLLTDEANGKLLRVGLTQDASASRG